MSTATTCTDTKSVARINLSDTGHAYCPGYSQRIDCQPMRGFVWLSDTSCSVSYYCWMLHSLHAIWYEDMWPIALTQLLKFSLYMREATLVICKLSSFAAPSHNPWAGLFVYCNNCIASALNDATELMWLDYRRQFKKMFFHLQECIWLQRLKRGVILLERLQLPALEDATLSSCVWTASPECSQRQRALQ